jgi:hypothetical protein
VAKLWFSNSFGKRREIAECNTFAEVMTEIDRFITSANDKWPNKKPFKRYYTRIWNEDGQSVFDVGSHTEFFYFDLPYPEDEHGFVDEEKIFNE